MTSRLPDAVRPSPGDALRSAIERYLRAYGPASVADAGRWIGQPRLTLVRAAVEALGDRIRRYRGPDDRELVDLDDAPIASGEEPATPRFLARWDSAILGYEVRDRILPPTLAPHVILRKNGDFLPSFTVDGLIAGTWSVASDGGATIVEIEPVTRLPPTAKAAVLDEGERLATFISRGRGATSRPMGVKLPG